MNIARPRLLAWRCAGVGALMLIRLPLPAHAGAPFVTDDPGTTPPGDFEIDLAATHGRLRGETSGGLPSLEVDYGAGSALQLHAVAALAYTRPDGGSLHFGYGDTELGAKLRFLAEDEQGWRPAAALFPLVEAPTGDARQGLGAGRPRAFVPLCLGKSTAGWNIFGGGGYWFDPGPGDQNWWLLCVAATRKVTGSLALGGEVFHASARRPGGKDGTGFNLGGSYDFSAHHHLLLSAGRGLRNGTTSNQLSGYLAYQLTF